MTEGPFNELHAAYQEKQMPDIGADRLRTIVDGIDQKVLKTHNKDEENFPNYSERVYVRLAKVKYEMHFATDQDNPADKVQVATHHDAKGDAIAWEEHSVLARIFKVVDTDEGPVTTCYKLLRDNDGKESWIAQNSDKSNTENSIRTWDLGGRRELDTVEARALLGEIKSYSDFLAIGLDSKQS